MMKRRSFVLCALPLALLSLSACAESFNAQVNRFQAMPVPQGQSFVVKSGDPRRDSSLEFASYAGLVAQKLSAVGYRPAGDAASADLVVTLDYGVDKGREKQRPSSGWGYDGFGYGGYPYGYGRRGYIYGFNDPFMFGAGFDRMENYTVYTSDLNLIIAKKDGQRLFEGKAKAVSSGDNLTYLVPNLVEAMFTRFPGNSGETVQITVAPPPKKS